MFCSRCGNRAYRYSLSEVARALAVAPQTVAMWVRNGKLSASNPEPGVYRVRASAVKRMLANDPGLQVRTAWRYWLRDHDEAMRGHYGVKGGIHDW